MKSFILKWIAIMAILVPCGTVAATPSSGFVIYSDIPITYAEMVEFVTITNTNAIIATVVLPTGKRQEIPRGGIIAVINFPPDRPTESLPQDAAASIRNIQLLRSKYPQFAAKFDAAQARWASSLEAFRQRERLEKPKQPAFTPTLTLTVDGITYSQVVLTSFDGVTAGIMHASGAAGIPAIKLKAEQITALNTTSSSVKIDPIKIIASPPPPKPKGIPRAWVQSSPESAHLAAAVRRCFPAATSDEAAYMEAIRHIPGIETKEPGIAELIINDLENGRAFHGIERSIFWALFSKALDEWKEAGVPGDCPHFLTHEFLEALIRVKVSQDMENNPILWQSERAESLVLFHFADLVWAAQRAEIKSVVALGSLIDRYPWEEIKSFKLTDGTEIGNRLERLETEVAKEHCVAIEFMVEGILQQIPASAAFSESQVLKKASALSGLDFENAYNHGLLQDLGMLHARSFRWAVAARVAGILRQRGRGVPDQFHDPEVVRKFFGGFTSLDALQSPSTIAPKLGKAFPMLSEPEIADAANAIAEAAGIAVKELTNSSMPAKPSYPKETPKERAYPGQTPKVGAKPGEMPKSKRVAPNRGGLQPSSGLNGAGGL